MKKIGDIIRANDFTEAALWANANGARLEERDLDHAGRRFEIVKDEKTKDEKTKEEIDGIKEYLRATDYVVIKIAEKTLNKDEKGIDDDVKKYSDILAERSRARDRINELEGDVK